METVRRKKAEGNFPAACLGPRQDGSLGDASRLHPGCANRALRLPPRVPAAFPSASAQLLSYLARGPSSPSLSSRAKLLFCRKELQA